MTMFNDATVSIHVLGVHGNTRATCESARLEGYLNASVGSILLSVSAPMIWEERHSNMHIRRI